MLELLTGINDLLYEVLTYLVLIPKTLLKVLFRPRWICSYVECELKKKPSERFKDYAQPMILFVFVAVLPYMRLLNFSTMFSLSGDWSDILRDYKSLGTEIKIFAVFLYLVTAPLTPTLVVQLYRRTPLTSDSLRPLFFAQAYCFGVYYLLTFPACLAVFEVYIAKQRPNEIFLSVVYKMSVIAILWLLYSQVRIIRHQLTVGVWKAIGIMIVCCGTFILIVIGCEAVLVFGFLYGHSNGD